MRAFIKNKLQGRRGPVLTRWLPGSLALTLIFSAETATAWGPDGHRIVCEIAQIRLLPRTRAIIHQNFNIKYLTLVANWADVIKRGPRKPDVLHHTNIEAGKWTYDQTRDCPEKKCVTEKIREFEKVLANKRLFYFARKETLAQFAERLDARTTDDEMREWTRSYVENWSNESRELSVKYGYPLSLTDAGELTDEYIARGRLIVEKQLRRAGVRLAHILNRSLK